MENPKPPQPSPKGQNGGKPGSKPAAKPAAKSPVAAPMSEPIPASVAPLFRKIDWLTFAVTTLLVFIGYYLTLSPNLGLEDSGELAVASMYAGIPHPPGYPVWTLYTWVFTVILPFSNMAWRVAVASAVAGAVASGLIGLLVSRGSSMMMEGIAELKNIDRRWESAICVVSGFVAGMLLGFNGYMWSQSVIVEVYALSALSLVCVLLFLMRWVYAPHQHRYLYLAFFMFGICFNNHQSLLVVALALEVFVIAAEPRLARWFFFGNTVMYLAGLWFCQKGMLGVMTSNLPVFVIFNIIGLISAGVWALLTYLQRQPVQAIVGIGATALGVLLFLLQPGYPSYKSAFTVIVALVVMVGLAVYEAYEALTAGRSLGPWRSWKWVVTLLCGISFIIGTAFYLYMPLAGATNPPMQWGYPRTVEGFVHAFTRGQYEKIHPTSGVGDNFFEQSADFLNRYAGQMGLYLEGLNEEFNLVYLLIALVMFFFFHRMQKRERAWTTGVTFFFLTLGPFLVILLNPPPDRQAKELIRVFFTASHVLVAMGVGYGLTLIAATMATQYERLRTWFWAGGAAAGALTLWALAKEVTTAFGDKSFFAGLGQAFGKDQYAMPVHANIILLGMVAVFIVAVLVYRNRAPLGITLLLFAAMPLHSIMSHWYENEQRGHLFGYWFGHDMFTPPFTGKDGKFGNYNLEERKELMKDPEKAKFIYPEMTRDAILYGGTDPGRFCPTYMIFCESFIPPRCKQDTDPAYDRRDVYIITQNALADGTYLNYIRAHYNKSEQVKYDSPFFQEAARMIFGGKKEIEQNYTTNFVARLAGSLLDRPLNKIGSAIEARRRREGVYPMKEMYIATPEDSQRCFKEYLDDAQVRLQRGQLKPGEDVKIVDNKVQVSGQVAVMAINGLLTKVMFDKNPTNEFFVEESFPLDWMFPHLTPFGVIMKINRQPLPSLTEEIMARDHEFWSRYSERLIGNWITYETPVKDIVEFAEKTYLRRDFSGYKGDRKFARDDQAQKAFSKLRSSIGGVYTWRLNPDPRVCPPEFRPKTEAEILRIYKEADFTFRQAFAFCPYSPEAVFRYINLLIQPPHPSIAPRLDDALLVAKTCQKLDPNNGQVGDLIRRLEEFKKGASAADQARTALAQLQKTVAANPSNFPAVFELATAYMQLQQPDRATALMDAALVNPAITSDVVLAVASFFARSQNWPKLEASLDRLVKVAPESPEAWYELARFKGAFGKTADALNAVGKAITLGNQRRATNPGYRDYALEARGDTNFASLRNLPEFQKLITPQ